MRRNDIKNLKNSTVAELKTQLANAKKDVFNLHMDLKRNKAKNTRALFEKRKDVARILTVIHEKELLEKGAES